MRSAWWRPAATSAGRSGCMDLPTRQINMDLIEEALEFFRQTSNFDPVTWLADERNIVLENNLGDIALFEYQSDGIVIGHYYFKSRGREAVQSALKFLERIFDPCYNIHVIKGITALDHLGARWLSRRIGFKSYGVVHAQGRAAELFILTASEYRSQHERNI